MPFLLPNQQHQSTEGCLIIDQLAYFYLLIEWCSAGVTNSNAVCMQAAVPGVNVHEHSATHDGRVNYVIISILITVSVNIMLWRKCQKQFHPLSCISSTCLVLLTV